MGRTIPIIRLYDTLLVSIQIVLSDHLVKELKENISCEVRRRRTNGLVIEVSGVDVFDSYIARSIRDIAQIAELMGTPTILAGLDAGMAITLVEMNMHMSGVETALNLENAFDILAERRKREEQEGGALIADCEAGPAEVAVEDAQALISGSTRRERHADDA